MRIFYQEWELFFHKELLTQLEEMQQYHLPQEMAIFVKMQLLE